VLADLTGHGIGRRIHEPPTVYNVADPPEDAPLTDGLVITIEPIIAGSTGEVVEGDDGWTVLTADGSLAAHAEHTIVITPDRPILLTA
jgi:methionyl aminopeptidase